MVNLDYFYGSEGEQYRFYQIPAILLEDEEYKKISDTAKLLYGILLSRLALSKKNNWIEKETNRVYTVSYTHLGNWMKRQKHRESPREPCEKPEAG